MRIGLMVEAQSGLTWSRWFEILALAERLGFPTVLRSDHYFIGRQQDSLEAFLSFVPAALETSSIRFGPLTSPVMFRRPVEAGRMAAQLSQLSGGRFVLGLGVGWSRDEHLAYGIDFPEPAERFQRLAEALHVIRLLWREGPSFFDGRYSRLRGANCLPKPPRGRVPIVVGGSSEDYTLRIAARYGDEWNALNLTPDECRQRRTALARHCDEIGRDPSTIATSVYPFGWVGKDEAMLDRATRRAMEVVGLPDGIPPARFRDAARERGWIIGTTDEVVDNLGRLAEAGVDEVQFNCWSNETAEYLAADVVPAVAAF
ncbi:MAG: LLM class flavin-dependent oxidoreductase [Dehalococcoidia bacterium]